MPEFYESERGRFVLDAPGWRKPQLGAVASLVRHWTLRGDEPAVIALPTGTGKTAVAMAAPFVRPAPPARVLIVVPSVPLREQITENFRTQRVLLDAGALEPVQPPPGPLPSVYEMTGRTEAWPDLEEHDVVVALPSSISPSYYENNGPPDDLFDLVIFDEAHHVPADTWRSVLEHFDGATAVLLTATPIRRDKKRLPGEVAYHYPLRKALAEKIYQPIAPSLVAVPAGADREAIDGLIRDRVVQIALTPEHAGSAVLIRGRTIDRAKDLAALYSAAGLPTEALHSRLSEPAKASILDNLANGDTRAVSVVDMLGEGYDLPSLRIAAYHDKHKSVPATVQLIGRLARVSPDHPQASTLVTAQDADIFPELQGVLRTLYEEDADWLDVLPGILDDQIQIELEDRQFVEALAGGPPPDLSLTAIEPLRRAVVYEIEDVAWQPVFSNHQIPDGLAEGALFRGATVIASLASQSGTLWIVLLERTGRPRWSTDASFDTQEYELALVGFAQSAQVGLPSLLFISTDTMHLAKRVRECLGLEDDLPIVAPERVSRLIDSWPRVSVSSLGVRSTHAGRRGTATYRNYLGSGVDRGLRDADTSQAALGHAMVQVAGPQGAFTAGVATGKGKIWETRYTSLREYEAWVGDMANGLWFPGVAPAGQLVPQLSRGERLLAWPQALPVAAELHPALIGRDQFQLVTPQGEFPIEDVEIQVGCDPTGTVLGDMRASGGLLPVLATVTDRATDQIYPVWSGGLAVSGRVESLLFDVPVRRGLAITTTLSSLLEDYPPTIYFLDGTTTEGPIAYDSRDDPSPLAILHAVQSYDFVGAGVDITAETVAKANEHGLGQSIHEELEKLLAGVAKRGRYRWVLCNDGSGEIADYLVIEQLRSGEVEIQLWHAKYSAGVNPGLRIGDLQEVTAQAVRSRRFLTDARFWTTLARRLSGAESPAARVVAGGDGIKKLLVACGYRVDDAVRPGSWAARLPPVRGVIGIVQPGVSRGALQQELANQNPGVTARNMKELLALLHGAGAPTNCRIEAVFSP